jgi:hypothetical protein
MKNSLIKDKRDVVQHVSTWSMISSASTMTDGACYSARGAISDMRHYPSRKANGTGHMVMMKLKSTIDSGNWAEPFDYLI